MPTSTYTASLTDTISKPLKVDRFDTSGRSTPGNVGVCLSGGGSRAMIAGMGQLAGLASLTDPNTGRSLLEEVKAISTVSGGSWAGVTFCFQSDDATFLGSYSDPSQLTKADVESLDQKNLGNTCANKDFSLLHLAWAAIKLHKAGVPADMLWQTLIGIHILEPYGLYVTSPSDLLPSSLFSADEATYQDDVIAQNEDLADETYHLLGTFSDGTTRPFLVCNTSMFVDTSSGTHALAPVQATPYFTGIVGSPDATDANSVVVGGGGVTSFAFSSRLESVASSSVEVNQTRQWSITDIVGASSAAFAELVGNAMIDAAAMASISPEEGDRILELLKARLPDTAIAGDRQEGLAEFDPDAIVPHYFYWPVQGARANENAVSCQFADGGNLENSGIASLLAYEDIDSIIAFVNSSSALEKGLFGVIDAGGREVPNSRYKVDSQIPPLFGYQPYHLDRKGYREYSKDSSDVKSRSQVFDHGDFAYLLRGLWAASNAGQSAATFQQTLNIKPNAWFGASGGRTVDVLWVYLNEATAWSDRLQPDVADLIPRDFPHYGTLSTDRTAVEVNLLANFTGWCVADGSNQSPFIALFDPS